jgi:hypothetical protein
MSFLLGAAAALVLLAAWRIPAGRGIVGADVTLSAALSEEVTLSQTGPFANASALTEKTRPLEGSIYAHNSTGRPLMVRARLRGDTPDLDDALLVEVTSGRVSVYRGPLGGLSRWTAHVFRVGPDQTTRVTVRGRLRTGTRREYEGRVLVASLELRAGRPS